MECSCPFCPLVAINLQVCNVKVIFPKSKTQSFSTEIVLDDTLPDFIKNEIIKITMYFKNNLKLKIGHGKVSSKKEYYCNVERQTKNEFKFCFHSNPNY